MKTKAQIEAETIEVYFAIKATCKIMKTDYCHSWWINKWNYKLSSPLPTYTINQRAKRLVKDGYLTIIKQKSSRSTGTCYLLTDKIMEERAVK